MADPDRPRSTDLAWRNFRTVAVGCPVGWLLAVGLFAVLTSGRYVDPEPGPLVTVMLLATAFYAMLPACLYPWDRRQEGSQNARQLVVLFFLAGFVLLVFVFSVSAVVRPRLLVS